jgi:hypothetical protein
MPASSSDMAVLHGAVLLPAIEGSELISEKRETRKREKGEEREAESDTQPDERKK